jgi:hypothetical protein
VSCGALQFLGVMGGFGLGVAFEGVGQAAVSAAIGVSRENDAFGRVQADGFADLIEDEFAIGIAFGRGDALGSAGDFDRIRPEDANMLEKFAKREIEAVVITPDDGGVAEVSFAGSVEVEDLAHGEIVAGDDDVWCLTQR